MNTASTTAGKKTTRTRKTAAPLLESTSAAKPISLSKNLKAHGETFADLLRSINESKEGFMALQKEIDEVREAWIKEQNSHKIVVMERDQQEEIARKRENETYAYEVTLARKKSEDDFLEKKAKWERELEVRKEELAKEKLELENLRKLAGNFDQEKEKAVNQACILLEKELSETYSTEKRLREQELKGEKEILVLKIDTLTQENARQAQEIAIIKKSLEDATVQLKDVAVKVIESRGNKAQSPVSQEQ